MAEIQKSTRLFSFKTSENPSGGTAPVVPTPPLVAKPQKLFTFSTPKDTPAPAAAMPADVFMANLQTQQKVTDSKQQSEILKSLMKTEEKTVEKKKSILGELPKIDTSLFIDREYHLKKQLSFVRFAFAFLLLLGFAGFVFFYTQLTPTFDLFGANVAQQLEDKNAQLKNIQTDVNYFRLQTSKTLLDQFGYFSDAFLQKYHEYQVAQTEVKKQDLLVDLNSLRQDMYTPFESAREKLLTQNWVPLFRTVQPTPDEATQEFNEFLRQRLRDERVQKLSSLKAAQQVSSKQQIQAELLQNSELLGLVGKPELQKLLRQNIRDMSHDQLATFIGNLAKVYPSRLGFIYQVKQKRIPWAATLHEIDARTRFIDPLYRTGFFAKLGGILYNAFDFDATSGRIGLSGQVKSDDGTNFSVMSNLIDELEGSSKFQDADMRSFNKRYSDNGGYEGSFKIDFKLQTDPLNPKDKQYRLAPASVDKPLTPTSEKSVNDSASTN